MEENDIKFKAERYVMLRKTFFLYLLFFFANDSKKNDPKLVDRNLSVIQTSIFETWFVIENALYSTLFTSIMDMFELKWDTKASVLYKGKDSPKEEENFETKITRELKKYDLEEYASLMDKLKKARDKYIVHTERVTTRKDFPIKVQDLFYLHTFLNEVEIKILTPEIRKTGVYLAYNYDNHFDDILQEFDYMMNLLRKDYLLGNELESASQVSDYLFNEYKDEILEIYQLSLKRREKNLKSENNIFIDQILEDIQQLKKIKAKKKES